MNQQSRIDGKNDIKHDMYLGAPPSLLEVAKQLRTQETPAEKLLWTRLSRNQLGVKFRRQHPIYYYVADFYCHSHKIVVEVDGPIHDSKENQFNDLLRTSGFNEFDIEVLQFTNEEVMNNIEDVVLRIQERLKVREKFF